MIGQSAGHAWDRADEVDWHCGWELRYDMCLVQGKQVELNSDWLLLLNTDLWLVDRSYIVGHLHGEHEVSLAVPYINDARLRCKQLFLELQVNTGFWLADSYWYSALIGWHKLLLISDWLQNWEQEEDDRQDHVWVQIGYLLSEAGHYNLSHPLTRVPESELWLVNTPHRVIILNCDWSKQPIFLVTVFVEFQTQRLYQDQLVKLWALIGQYLCYWSVIGQYDGPVQL